MSEPAETQSAAVYITEASDRLPDLIKELQLTFSAFARRWRGKEVSPGRYERQDIHQVTCEAVQNLSAIQKRWQAERFVAAFVGLSNAGKSTLLNALFGQEITPRSSAPTTQVPIEFKHSSGHEVSVVFRRDFRQMHRQCGTADELRSVLGQYVAEGGDHASGNVAKVVAGIPLNILAGDLVMADTPGFGAAQIGDREGAHHRALVEYLPNAHQVFWVVRFEQGITQIEASFYKEYLSKSCSDIIVTGCDEVTGADKKRFHKWAEEQLGLNFMQFYFLSGKKALQAKLRNDPQGAEQSGLSALEERLKLMGARDTRNSALAPDVLNLCGDFGAWVKDRKLHSNPWPQVEWMRLRHFIRDKPDWCAVLKMM